MGKQWLLCKVAGDGTAAGGCNGTTNTKSGGKSRKRRGDRHVSSSSSSSTGCMTAIFHLFDIQHHHFPFHQPSFISESTISLHQEPNNIILKGVEAPRNSLELEEQEKTPVTVEEEVTSSSSTSSSTRKQLKQVTNFNTPIRDIQIKTKRSRLMDINDTSSECSSPGGAKTPSLVARLMGLDLLPENSSPRASLSSPRPSSSSSHATPLNPLSKLSSLKNNYTRSLPVTPRASTTGRPSTEVDYHHRLSLQVINKENKRRYDESSSEYAKQIAKQVRENISRRVGADITNMSKKKEHRRDEFLVVLKPKRSPSPPSSATPFISDQGHGRGKENEPTPPNSCSPRLKLLEIKKNNLNKPIPKSSPLSSSSSSSSTEVVIKAPPSLLPSSTTSSRSPPPPPPMMMKEQQVQVIKHNIENNPMKVQKCKKLIASEKYDLRLRKLHHQNDQEPAAAKCNNMKKKKKSTPLSNQLVNNVVNTTTKFISFKKDIIVSPHPSSSPQKQEVTYESITHLSSCQSRSYNTKKTINLSVQHDITTNGNVVAATTTGASFSDHFEYISRILCHAGIEKTTPISITHWYSPSHPLHPSILENLNQPKTVTNRLIFDVVDELLVEILKPYISLKPWVSATRQTKSRRRMFGTQLIETLCNKISCFPEANCQVLEDIDGLIESDMKSNTKVIGDIAFEEEAEELVAEIERDMVDTLVGEMAAAWITCHVGSM